MTTRYNYHYAPRSYDMPKLALCVPFQHSFFAQGGPHLKDFWVAPYAQEAYMSASATSCTHQKSRPSLARACTLMSARTGTGGAG
jgi:hypothetical protein